MSDDDTIVIAVPSKGRLEEETRRVFGEARLPINRPGGERSYSGSIKGQPQVQVRVVPLLVGRTSLQAARALNSNGLTSHRVALGNPNAIVVRQFPIAGTVVSPGTRVTIYGR